MKKSKEQARSYPLRLDPELKQWVQDRAKSADRSYNAEINRLLRQAKEAEEAEQKAA